MTHSRSPYMLRCPALSETHVAFSYGGNIWLATRNGDELRRLTSAGQESNPALSPDGQQIAFIGEYGGSRGVFVLPIAGGDPRRITHHPADLGYAAWRSGDTVAWTPNGKHILFSSRRSAFVGGADQVVQLFTVPVDGGFASPLPLNRAVQGSFSPNAKRMAYVPHLQSQPQCKRYRGGQARSIWIVNLSDSCMEARIPRDRSNDFNPMWVGDTIYFLSDRNGPMTLFSYDVKSREVRQILENKGLDLKSASAYADTIVYEQFGSLHLFDIKSGRGRVLDIRPIADFPEVRSHVESVASLLRTEVPWDKVTPKLSPTGARAVFGARGRVFTVPAEKGDGRVLTQASGVVERDPAWSPDGQSIAYFSDESGEFALHVRDQGGLGAVRKIVLGHPASFFYVPVWSPDSKKIGYTDKRLNYWYVDLSQGVPVRIDTDLYTDTGRGLHDLQMAWSPDSRWLAYGKQLVSHLHAVFVYSIEERQSRQLTDGMSDARFTAFDRSGEYLYFTASTDVGAGADWLDIGRIGRSLTRGVYAVVLRKTGVLTAFQSDEEGVQSAGDRSRNPVPLQDTVNVQIDFEEIHQRIVPLPLPWRNYYGVLPGPAGVIFLVEGPQIEEPFALVGYPLQKVHRFDLHAQKSEQILDEVVYFDLSSNGEKMLYGRRQGSDKQWFIAAARKIGEGSLDLAPSPLKFESLEFVVDPRADWKHMFRQVWRNERDFFYDPGLHGLDLEQISRTYEPFLDNIVTREDLDCLFEEMLGNMTVLHVSVVGPQAMKHKRVATGLLGADYSEENGRYRFARIYDRDPWNADSRSPLRTPGSNVQAGEYLLEVSGREVRAPHDVFHYFAETAGKQVTLKVGPKPDGTKSREVVVVPITDEYPLRYFAWIEENRRRVDEVTNGRVAYVHLPDMTTTGYAAFNRYFFAQAGKDAIIIDNRFNGGGLGPAYIIDCLRRQSWCYWHLREGRDITIPLQGIFGPKVMLINEGSSSMGECLPWMFRRAGLGPLIGTRTWGGLVGGHVGSPLLDGGSATAPNLAFYTPEGTWEVENVGVSPDIEVEDDPGAAYAGRDVQLEKAVEVVLDLLKKRPASSPPRHPPPPKYCRDR